MQVQRFSSKYFQSLRIRHTNKINKAKSLPISLLLCYHSNDMSSLQNMNSAIFESEKVSYAGVTEQVVPGGRRLFSRLPHAFEGIKQISVIGWGSQGPAQAQNLRDSLVGSEVKVVIGLREGSASWAAAEQAGFSASDGMLMEMYAAIASGDLVILLISDGAQSELYKKIFATMKKGATLGLSHGFLLGCLKLHNEKFPQDINVIGVCPKGMGPSVRRLYEQGREQDGAGINTSVAVEQDINGKALDYALGWSVALGAPFSFLTTLELEYRSDIFGERAILLGAVHGIVEQLYQYKIAHGTGAEEAFTRTVESITGVISHTISRKGIIGVYRALPADQQDRFALLYNRTYYPAFVLLREVYEEVRSGNEIRSVSMRTARLKEHPMDVIGNSPMWQVGARVRAARSAGQRENGLLDTDTAAIYVATMMAQVDLLAEMGHSYSEIVNESVIEAVDSLNPYMHYRGVSFMIDNCSTTARLGARKWAPRFDYMLRQEVLPSIDDGTATSGHGSETDYFQKFTDHPVHEVLGVLAKYRPSIDIAVTD